ncbi:MAG: hypothetical protein ACHP84_16620 [Caulobacterales bacterium]
MRRLILLLALASAIPQPAAASDEPSCDPSSFTHNADIVEAARVAHADTDGRLHFSSGPSGLPCDAPTCQGASYVVQGDELLTGLTLGDYVCAWFKPRGRQDHFGTLGWLRAGALTAVPTPASPPMSAWAGDWVRDRELGLPTSLTLRPLRNGRLKVTGASLFAHSREDIARGAVNTGEVDQALEVRGRAAGLMLSDAAGQRQSFLGKDYDYACKIGMVLVGDWLVAADDGACGGLNVSFLGVYRRDR